MVVVLGVDVAVEDTVVESSVTTSGTGVGEP